MSNYVEGFGWLTPREYKWWASDDDRLRISDFGQKRQPDWKPTRFKYVENGLYRFKTIEVEDKRWNPAGIYGGSSLGMPPCAASTNRRRMGHGPDIDDDDNPMRERLVRELEEL